MATDLQKIEQDLKELKKELEKLTLVDELWLFGSQLTGQQKEWSDIDVALVSSKFEKDYWQQKKDVLRLGLKINDNFEFHLFSPEEFANPYDPLVSEIKKYGQII